MEFLTDSMDEESLEDKRYQLWILESSLWNWFRGKFQGDGIGVTEAKVGCYWYSMGKRKRKTKLRQWKYHGKGKRNIYCLDSIGVWGDREVRVQGKSPSSW